MDQRIFASPIGTLRRLLRKEDGGVLVIAGLSLPVLIGFGAIAIDIARWYDDDRNLQTAADAAAVGAALELTAGRSGTMVTQATANATQNGVVFGPSTTITVNSPPNSGPNSGNAKAVEVILTRPATRTLSAIALNSDPTVRARAVALSGNDGEFCVLGLQEVQVAVLVSGNAEVVLDCGVAANADLRMNGNSAEMTATSATVVGDVTGHTQNLDVPDGALAEGTNDPFDDPYEDVAVPSPLPGNGSISAGSPKTYTPGMFNSDIQITNGTHNFQPGTYVLNNSDLTITGGTVTATGVTFIFTGTSANNIGGLDIHGNPNVTISAPTTGAYAGLAFYQNRTANQNGVNKINGTSNVIVTGAVYFPAQEVDIQGNNSTGGTGGCTQIIARKVTFSGNSDIGFECEGTGVRAIGATQVVLVE